MTSFCPITYEQIPEGTKYSAKGLRALSPRLKSLDDFPYSAEQQRREAIRRAGKISIQGVQPKLSARLDTAGGVFKLVDKFGQFIVKPANALYRELPENEDLTMRLAHAAGIRTPLHGLMYCSDGSLSYFVKRYDRFGRRGRIHVEDFAQLTGRTRDTKYDSSMEQVAQVVAGVCTFPAVENLELFRRTLFSVLTGNEDMHLKNFSLIYRDDIVRLSPAYDLTNSSIVLESTEPEEIALPLKGRKRKISSANLFDYFGCERLGIRKEVVNVIRGEFIKALPTWRATIDKSFLSPDLKGAYAELLRERARRFLS